MQDDKIKVYRVLPDIYNLRSRHSYYHPEAIYYYMGYTPFYGRLNRGYANNIGERLSEEGKFFYIFPEDALAYSLNVVTSKTAKIVEYEFPIDDVLNIIGLGDYENKPFSNKKITETVIEKSQFKGKEISSDSIDSDIKLNASIQSLKDTYDIIEKKYHSISELKRKIIKNRMYKELLKIKYNLVQSKEITNRIWTINNYIDSADATNIYILEERGLSLDYSKYAIDARDEINYYLLNSNKEEALKLIKSYKK